MMKEAVKHRLRMALSKRGLSLQREISSDMSPETVETIRRVRPYTMTTVERIAAVCTATEYIVRYDVPGAFVESGVWKGGSSMAAALTLVNNGVTDREFHLFDTFEGIPAPGEHDALIGGDHESLMKWWQKENAKKGAAWLDAPVDQVLDTLAGTGYPRERLHAHVGLVEDTVPANAPDQIAFLRLDTDYYSSTKTELDVMFERLSPGGVMIIDDYGYTAGTRKAVDEFLETWPEPLYLSRIDTCGRLVVRPGKV
jgi:O-methyltransferase